jgi:acetylornithine deacetylase
MRETTRILRDLVALPSVNPMGRALQGPEVFEHQVTAYLEEFFRSLGVAWQRQIVAPLRDNIVAVHEPAGATSTLVFEVHQDTVPTDHMTIPPFGAQIDNGRLYGRGACDVKGGIAAMLTAFARALRSGSGRKRLVLACTVDEEFTFLGVQRLVRDDLRGNVSGPVLAVVAEPTCLDIVHAHKGAVRWHLRTAGRSCHSSRPELGVNAIYRMAALLPLVERYAHDLRQSRSDALLGPATMSVGRIEGGTSVNTVPDSCHVEIDRRTLPGESTRSVHADFDEYLRKNGPAGIEFTCAEPWLSCPALSPAGSARLIEELGRFIDEVRGSHHVGPVPYGTDASSLAESGVPSVVFGPGNIDQAHTCDEWIDLEEVEMASEILYRLAIAT